jgi:hypothetical protein
MVRPAPLLGKKTRFPPPTPNWAGDVMSFHVLGRVVVILGSTKATKDLLEKHGHVFSDRAVIPIFEMYVTEKQTLAFHFYFGFG